jgi:hypothetical protein
LSGYAQALCGNVVAVRESKKAVKSTWGRLELATVIGLKVVAEAEKNVNLHFSPALPGVDRVKVLINLTA